MIFQFHDDLRGEAGLFGLDNALHKCGCQDMEASIHWVSRR